MKVLIVKTVPGEIVLGKITYNYQELGLAKALTRIGHQCDILCCSDKKQAKHRIDIGEGQKVTLYCLKALKILKNGFYINATPLFEQYDILHVSEYNQLYTWYLSKKYRDKIVIYHGPYYSEFNKRYNAMSVLFDTFFLNRYIKLNTVFITKSGLATEYLQERGIKNILTIGVGIDVEALTTFKTEKLEFVEKVRNCVGKKLLYIGRIEPRRNVYFLLDVLSRLTGAGEDVSLVLVGRGDKAYVKEFFNYARKINVYDRIIYKESVDQKYMDQLYSIADVFLLPTIYDIFGMVLLESMYFGKSVITTVNGGSNMLINNTVNGFVIDRFDVNKWCDCICYLLKNPNIRKKVEIEAQKKVANEFTWNILVNKFLETYDRKINDF